MRNGSRKLLINPPCPALPCGRCIQSFYQTLKRKKPEKGGKKNRQAAKTAGYLVGVRIADDQHLQVIWQYHSSVLTLVGTRLQNLHRLLFLLLLFFHRLPHDWILLPTLEKLHNKHHFLLLLFPEKSLWEEQKMKARLVAAARERSLARSSKRWRARNEKQTNPLASSLARSPSRESPLTAPAAAAATSALPLCNHTTHSYGGRFLCS